MPWPPISLFGYTYIFTPHVKIEVYFPDAFTLVVKNGCFNASTGEILLSGFRARQRSRRSMKRFSSLVSESLMPLEAAMRRVRRSRVGLTTGRILVVCC